MENETQYIEPERLHPAKSKTTHFFGLIIIVVFLFAFLTAYLTQHIHVMGINVELQKIENKMKNLKRENELLEIKLAKDTYIGNIDEIAISRLNMIRPNTIKYLIVKK